MTLVILLTNEFLPNWQKGITVNIEEPKLSELLKEGKVQLVNPVEVKPVEEVKVVETPKKAKKKV